LRFLEDSTMGFFEIIAILLAVTALSSYVNHRFLKLHAGVGVMLVGVLASVTLTILERAGLPVKAAAQNVLNHIDFRDIVLEGLLGFLLFAAALQVNLDDLARNKWRIAAFALVTTFLSTLLVGGLFFAAVRALGLPIRFIECLMFGAIISPTDTVATISILRKAGVPKSLDLDITGESLFNDAVGIVLFMTLLRISQGEPAGPAMVAGVFFVAVVGGLGLGLTLGYLAYRMLKTTDQPRIQVLITLAVAAGGYVLATDLGISGPLAIVAAGLVVGKYGRQRAVSEQNRAYLDTFWEVLDEILNALLFVLMGLQVLVLEQTLTKHVWRTILAGLIAIPVVLLARLASVGVPMGFLRLRYRFSPHTLRIMTWGGLRGGVCLALALALPEGTPHQDAVSTIVLTVTYVVVAFSILVQGLTLRGLVSRSLARSGDKIAEDLC
jgi:CPA1 family monovalent cation:H+ antiporter